MSINVYAVDISKNMRKYRKHVLDFISKNDCGDNVLILFDTETPISSILFETKPEYLLWTNCMCGVNEA